MKIKLELPDDTVMIYAVIIQDNADRTAGGMVAIRAKDNTAYVLNTDAFDVPAADVAERKPHCGVEMAGET